MKDPRTPQQTNTNYKAVIVQHWPEDKPTFHLPLATTKLLPNFPLQQWKKSPKVTSIARVSKLMPSYKSYLSADVTEMLFKL